MAKFHPKDMQTLFPTEKVPWRLNYSFTYYYTCYPMMGTCDVYLAENSFEDVSNHYILVKETKGTDKVFVGDIIYRDFDKRCHFVYKDGQMYLRLVELTYTDFYPRYKKFSYYEGLGNFFSNRLLWVRSLFNKRDCKYYDYRYGNIRIHPKDMIWVDSDGNTIKENRKFFDIEIRYPEPVLEMLKWPYTKRQEIQTYIEDTLRSVGK